MPVKNRSHSRSRSHRGGRVSMPSEYFGGNSGRYFAEGSTELADGSSAYGPFYSVSQGVASPDGQMFGPNVGPYPAASCTQTGGKKSKKSKKSTKKSVKKSNKKSPKKSKKSKKGSFFSRLFKK
jgi:hypothetical protein